MPDLAELTPKIDMPFDWQAAEAQFSPVPVEGAPEATQSLVDAASLAMNALEQRLSGHSTWLSADDLPSVHAVRQQTDVVSRRLLHERQSLVDAGEAGKVPYAFDVLATARRVLEAERLYGKDSQEYQQLCKGFYLDTKRHRDEARRRLTWEFFEEVEQPFDDSKDSFVYGGYVLKDIVNNGLSPLGSDEVGVDTLVANRREEYTSVALGKLGRAALSHAGMQPPDLRMTMLTISQIDTSPQTMVWVHRFDPAGNRRFQEQVAFPKDIITNDIVVKVLKQKEAIAADAQPTENGVLSTQSVSLAGEGALDIMQLLDAAASEETGKNIYMGEEVADDFVKDYAVIPVEAAKRQALNEEEVASLMAEILLLTTKGTDGQIANALIDKFVTDMLFNKVKDNPAAALPIFGQKTVDSLAYSLFERQRGNAEAADELLSEARDEAPTATVCTAGSCGLEAVAPNSTEAAMARELGLEGTIIRDTVRACPKCDEKTVFYDENGSKACINPNCRHTEIKRK